MDERKPEPGRGPFLVELPPITLPDLMETPIGPAVVITVDPPHPVYLAVERQGNGVVLRFQDEGQHIVVAPCLVAQQWALRVLAQVAAIQRRGDVEVVIGGEVITPTPPGGTPE